MKNTHTTEKTIFLIYNKKIKNQTKNKKSKTKQKKNDFPHGLVMSQGSQGSHHPFCGAAKNIFFTFLTVKMTQN